MRRTSRPLGWMVIDCLQVDSPTVIAAEKLAPLIDRTRLLPV